jgi:hypothetical protein
MIIFITTASHGYTHRPVMAEATGFRAAVGSYGWLLPATELPRATYVFTDLDRLSLPNLGRAAAIFRQLRAEGVRVLNDPAQIRSRYGLLRALAATGVNRFNAYRVEENAMPARWPVFLRSEGGHDYPLSDLLHSWDEVQRAIEAAVARGVPIASLLIVEFAAEAARPGVFVKLSVFRVGASMVACTSVTEDTWIVKYGKLGLVGDDYYADELRLLRENPYAEAMRRVFDIARIDYGRVDFGLVEGRPQIYEINTNPDMAIDMEHPSVARLESHRLVKRDYMEALRRIDSPDSADTIRIAAGSAGPA